MNNLNINLEQKIEEKQAKIITLLNNVGQGILIFNSDFKIDDEYSKVCEKYLGLNIANKDIATILFNDSNSLFNLTISRESSFSSVVSIG